MGLVGLSAHQVRWAVRLRKRLSDYLTYAQRQPGCQAILVLVDCDDDCPVDEARSLADQTRQLHLSTSVAIVLAHREYESWLIASIETMAGRYGLPTDLAYEGVVEARRDAKGWLTSQMPPGQAYKETIDQAKLTSLLDLDRARQRSRSFRRLCDAVDEVIRIVEGGQQEQVTP